MLTAKEYLRISSRGAYDELPEEFKQESDRLTKEFLAISIDPSEPPLFRTRSLRILGRFAMEPKASVSLDITLGLIAGFRNEFPQEQLADISKEMKFDGFHPDAWFIYLFCVTLAQIAHEPGYDFLEVLRRVFDETDLKDSLNRQLETIRRKRESL